MLAPIASSEIWRSMEWNEWSAAKSCSKQWVDVKRWRISKISLKIFWQKFNIFIKVILQEESTYNHLCYGYVIGFD